MGSYIKAVMVVGLQTKDILLSIDELQEFCSTSHNIKINNVVHYFSFYNKEVEDEDFSDAVFGLEIRTKSFRAIDMSIPQDEEILNTLKSYFKKNLKLEPKVLATFYQY